MVLGNLKFHSVGSWKASLGSWNLKDDRNWSSGRGKVDVLASEMVFQLKRDCGVYFGVYKINKHLKNRLSKCESLDDWFFWVCYWVRISDCLALGSLKLFKIPTSFWNWLCLTLIQDPSKWLSTASYEFHAFTLDFHPHWQLCLFNQKSLFLCPHINICSHRVTRGLVDCTHQICCNTI